jgi:hypothetical protein
VNGFKRISLPRSNVQELHDLPSYQIVCRTHRLAVVVRLFVMCANTRESSRSFECKIGRVHEEE